MRFSLWIVAAVVSAAVVHASPSLADVCTVDYGTCNLPLILHFLENRAFGEYLQSCLESSTLSSQDIYQNPY